MRRLRAATSQPPRCTKRRPERASGSSEGGSAIWPARLQHLGSLTSTAIVKRRGGPRGRVRPFALNKQRLLLLPRPESRFGPLRDCAMLARRGSFHPRPCARAARSPFLGASSISPTLAVFALSHGFLHARHGSAVRAPALLFLSSFTQEHARFLRGRAGCPQRPSGTERAATKISFWRG